MMVTCHYCGIRVTAYSDLEGDYNWIRFKVSRSPAWAICLACYREGKHLEDLKNKPDLRIVFHGKPKEWFDSIPQDLIDKRKAEVMKLHEEHVY